MEENGDKWLKDVAHRMKQEFENDNVPSPEEITAREFIRKFGWERRRPRLVNHIRNRLEHLALEVTPDFEFSYIDDVVRIELNAEAMGEAASTPPVDPTHRIRMLTAARKKPISVKPNDQLCKATTVMLLHDYSQLPVMQSDRDLRGIISWESIGARLSLGQECRDVKDCMLPAQEVPSTTPLFDAIGTIVEFGYVLVRGSDNKITGIVTASDLSEQFVSMAGPFLFIGQIEGYLRQLIHRKFTVEELKCASNDGDRIEGAADLTLGDYCRLLEKPDNWQKLKLEIDRPVFIKHLHEVREIRNDVMHFNVDLEENDGDNGVNRLSDVVRFFQNLANMGAI